MLFLCHFLWSLKVESAFHQTAEIQNFFKTLKPENVNILSCNQHTPVLKLFSNAVQD